MYESPFGSANETFEFAGEDEFGYESEQEFGNLEAELATELLEITSEAELDQFLGKLASSVIKGASTFLKSPVGKALGGVLKNVAKTALPAIGGALGSMIVPGAGTAIGAKLGSMAGGLIKEEEAELMSEAEAEFESAQRYVRFARSAWSNAARAPRNLPPRAVVRAASISAARRYAPTLLQGGLMAPWRQRRVGGYGRRPAHPAYRSAPWYVDSGYADSGYPDDGDAGAGYGDDVADWAGGYRDQGDGEPDPEADGGFELEYQSEGRGSGVARPSASGSASQSSGQSAGHSATEGRWVRRRGRIVLLGV